MKLSTCFKMISTLMIVTLLAAGCGGQSNQAAPGKDSQVAYLTIKDDLGRSVSLMHKPEKVVVLSPSFLELLYAVDGKAVGRPSSTAKLGIEAEQLQSVPEVGFVYNVNVEKVVSLQPDLVIAMQGLHEKLIPILESSKIPVIILKYKTYEDVFEKIALMGEIAGTKEKAQNLTQSMRSKLQVVSDKLPNKTTKIAILHATAKSVTLELENSIAGNTAKFLRLQNIAAGSRPIDDGADTAPYSLEKLVENDPDIIFVVTMGDAAKIEKTMRDDVENNPAWSTLRAVRDKKLVFLPSELFLLNPGLKTPEAAAYMAKIVYPEIYANDK